MYFSRVKLNLEKRATMIALATPSMFHGALEDAAEGARPHCLWRIDQLRGDRYLLVLSGTELDFSHIQEEYGADSAVETASYDNLLKRISIGDKWQFRLCANPTYHASPREGEKRGRLCAHSTVEHQREWLIKQSHNAGFSVSEDTFDVVQSRWYRFGKKKQLVTILAVTYEGILEVTDVELFLSAMKNGIGRGKAYGMGLLTIMSPRV